MIKVLLERGYCDEAIDLLTSDGRNSFSTMMNTGATTLWETWDGTCSHNHPMFGAVAELFFSHLLGIEFEDEEHIKVKPQTNKRLKNIRAKIKTDTGCFTVNYRMSDDKPIIAIDKK